MNIDKLEQKLGIKFKNKDLLKEAFTHRSYLNERHPKWNRHNERLEFLGDAVLEIAVTEFLYQRFPEKTEGELTALRSALINYQILSKIAVNLNLEPHLLLSKGEAREKGKARESILANLFEALIAAIYLEKGYSKVIDFLKKHLLIYLKEVIEKKLYQDAKSVFQEIAQEKFKITPVYKVLEEKGPDHKKEFKVGVYLEERLIAEGKGFSKQEAELKAAEKAINMEHVS